MQNMSVQRSLCRMHSVLMCSWGAAGIEAGGPTAMFLQRCARCVSRNKSRLLCAVAKSLPRANKATALLEACVYGTASVQTLSDRIKDTAPDHQQAPGVDRTDD